MDTEPAVVHGPGLSLAPSPTQVTEQQIILEATRRAEALTPEQVEAYNIQLTGSPRPNRQQRRAAEKRLRRAA